LTRLLTGAQRPVAADLVTVPLVSCLRSILFSLVLVAVPISFASGQTPGVNSGDVFNVNPGSDRYGTQTPQADGNTNEPSGDNGRDECGGLLKNRLKYDEEFHTAGVIMPADQERALDSMTQDSWAYYCGACPLQGGDKVICWPRPGYGQLIAQVSPGSQPVPQQQLDTSDPKVAAHSILQGWSSAKPLRGAVLYTTTRFKGQTLHAVKIAAPIFIGYQEGGVTLKRMVDGQGNTIIGGVTGTFSAWPNKPLGVGGPVVQNGKMVAPQYGRTGIAPLAPRSFLGYGPNGFLIEEIPAFQNLDVRARDLKAYVEGFGASQGIGGLARLLRSGSDVHAIYAKGAQRFDDRQISDEPNARAVAGVSADRRTLMLLIEEGNGQANPPTGAGMAEMGKILLVLGAPDAVGMDNGGSAQIYIPSQRANNRPNDGRALTTWILF
jgi:hypothetical protein